MVLREHCVSKADKTHKNMGRKLGDRMIKVLIPALNEIHVVIPIPETSNTSAPCVSESVREAVAKGPAGPEEIQRTTHGVEVNNDGKIGSPIRLNYYGQWEWRLACNR